MKDLYNDQDPPDARMQLVSAIEIFCLRVSRK